MRLLIAGAAICGLTTRTVAQNAPLLGARAVDANVSVKLWNTAGRLRIVGWVKDSVVVRGATGRGARLAIDGAGASVKVEVRNGKSPPPPASDITVYLPRGGKVAAKAVSAEIVANDVSGWFYSASGSIRLSGIVSSAEVESMSGNIDLDLTTPWRRARTGDGHILLRGAPEDADVATIGGALDIAARGIARGQFGSVSGDIRYAGNRLAGRF